MLKFLIPFILLLTSIDAYCQADSVISTSHTSEKTNSADEITIPFPQRDLHLRSGFKEKQQDLSYLLDN